MPTPDPAFQLAALNFEDSCLEITWRDDHISRYPGIWLLEACDCERCGNTITAVRHTRLTDNPAKPIRSCHVDLDKFYSRLRTLYAERQDPRRWMTFRKD